jgi:hypothetical protein
MPYYKFKETDIFYNRIKTYPQQEFLIYNSSVFINQQSNISGAFTGSVPVGYTGSVSLYELNVDRVSSSTGQFIPLTNGVINNGLIYPFLTKNGTLETFSTIGTASFSEDFDYGDVMTGSYPLTASVTREHFAASTTRDNSSNHVLSLKNTLNYYVPLSFHYQYDYSSSVGGEWNKGTQEANLISIPSIFYGSSIKRGSVNLKFYVTGTLIGELKDQNKNGELIQTGPAGSTGSGSVAGVVLYNEGFALLTGSWNLDNSASVDYTNESSASFSKWLHFGVGANDGVPVDADTNLSRLSASFDLNFSGTNYVPVVTMLAHAPAAELNYSNNPTYINLTQSNALTFYSSSVAYVESSEQKIKNTIKSPYTDPTGSYKPQTFISKVGIFDEDKNLIAVAKVATPVKKTEDRDLTFKLKLDF